MRHLLISALFAGALLAPAVYAESFEAGKQYAELGAAVPVAEPGKVEVVELFWYGCPHCYQFEPTINPWAAKLPADVNFVRIPAMFGGLWDVHGQLFLALESMKVEKKVHDAIFNAIQVEKRKLATPEEMAEFLATQGIDKDAFLKAYNSFGVKAQIEKAKKLAAAYQITGVPTMVVGGKYRFDIGSAGGAQEALKLADFLIDKERVELPKQAQ